jgi:hypothetical protein
MALPVDTMRAALTIKTSDGPYSVRQFGIGSEGPLTRGAVDRIGSPARAGNADRTRVRVEVTEERSEVAQHPEEGCGEEGHSEEDTEPLRAQERHAKPGACRTSAPGQLLARLLARAYSFDRSYQCVR